MLSLRSTGIPEILKLHWLKSTLAAKLASVSSSYTVFLAAAGLAGISRDVSVRSGQGSALYQSLAESDASRPERSCGTLGRNKRSGESPDKIGDALSKLSK